MPKKGLGRGLSALLPAETQDSREGVIEIELSHVSPNPGQPRQQFNEESIRELAASIKEYGVVQPVLVRAVGDRFELVAGERRLRAAREAGLSHIPAIVREMSDAQALEIALVENLQREDLNPIEQADAYRRLSDEFGLSQDEISRRVGKSRPQVSNVMRLLQLQKEVQLLVRAGKLSMGHARALLAIESGPVQKSAAERICAKGMSVRQAEAHVSALIGRPQRDTRGRQPARREPEIEDLEGRLRLATGTKIKITGDSNRGRLEIHYFSTDELERLTDGILSSGKRGR